MERSTDSQTFLHSQINNEYGFRLHDGSEQVGSSRRGSSLDAHEAFIVGLIDEHKDITLNEMVERLVVTQSVQISRSAWSAWFRSHGWTFKKSPRMRWSRTAPIS